MTTRQRWKEACARAPVPRVSVAVASYNYGRYLRECVRSALDQRDVDVDVVIVDDGSADDSVAIARELAAGDPRVRLIAHPRNRGHIATFNEALWAAEGDYVVKLDSDDMLTPGALARAARVLRAYPTLGLVYGNALTFAESPPPPARPAATSGVRRWAGADWVSLRCRRGTNGIRQPEAMVRASVLRLTDGHRAHLPATHDLNLWLRIAAISDVARINADQGCYRVHPDSIFQSRFRCYHDELVERRKAFDDFFDTLPPRALPADTARALRRQNGTRLARLALAHACRALDRGARDDEPADAYIGFALDVCPRARRLRQWRALQRRQDGRLWRPGGVLARTSEGLRRGQDRARWHLDQRFGA